MSTYITVNKLLILQELYFANWKLLLFLWVLVLYFAKMENLLLLPMWNLQFRSH